MWDFRLNKYQIDSHKRLYHPGLLALMIEVRKNFQIDEVNRRLDAEEDNPREHFNFIWRKL